jgi:prevent-host-death family protein
MNKIKNIISTTFARKNFFKLTEDVQKSGNTFTLTQNGEAKAVLLSYDEYESIKETLELLQDDSHALEHIEESKKEYASGDFDFFKPDSSSSNIAANFAVAEKKGKYVSGSRSKKSTKAKK